MRLLVVDDSSIMRRAISRHLKSLNLELVGTAGDGEEALKLFRQYEPEVVTMDITMPKMDGLETLERILDEKPQTKIVIISALADKGTGLKALTLGAKGFILKPFQGEDLVQEIRKVTGGEV